MPNSSAPFAFRIRKGFRRYCFGTLSVFGMEKQTATSLLLLLCFGTLSVFGMEKPLSTMVDENTGFGTLSVFGMEKLNIAKK